MQMKILAIVYCQAIRDIQAAYKQQTQQNTKLLNQEQQDSLVTHLLPNSGIILIQLFPKGLDIGLTLVGK